jgi:hypothetical protein
MIRPYRLAAPYLPGDSYTVAQSQFCVDSVHFAVYLGTLGDDDLIALKRTEAVTSRLCRVMEIEAEMMRRELLDEESPMSEETALLWIRRAKERGLDDAFLENGK